MSSTSVLCLFIDSEKKPISTAFDVDVGKQVSNLKDNALHKNPQEGAGPGRLRVWRCKDRNIVFNDSDLTELEDQITEIFESQEVESLSSQQAAADLQFSERECILLEILDPPKKRKHEHIDVHKQLKKAKLVEIAPSKISSITAYRSLQGDSRQKILDDRPSPDKDIPPVVLLYHGFGLFYDIFHGQINIPQLEKIDEPRFAQNVDRFLQLMGSYYLKEDARRNEGLKIINDILTSRSDAGNIPPLAASSILNYRSDGHMVGPHGGAVCVTEFKNEIHGISSVPYVEATAYAAQTHTAVIPALFRGWRVPCLGLTIVGYHVTFYAIVAIQHQYRVISLTPTLSCLPDASCGDDQKSIHAAFVAASVLLGCILEDSAKYAVFPPPEIPPGHHKYPPISRLPHYPKSKDSRSQGFVDFEIRDFYPARESYRWLYVAVTGEGKEILVKFTTHYSIALHEFCAARQQAPQVLGFDQLPGGWYCVAMEYYSSAVPLLHATSLGTHGREWVAELQDLVKSFHAENFVHGDLRDTNIICDDERFFLVDFDWGGKLGEACYPVKFYELNPELVQGRSSNNTLITAEDDDRVLKTTMNKVENRLSIPGIEHGDIPS